MNISKNGACVYVIGVPIGNYEDITYRALKTLKLVDLILCEDTRETSKLLDEFLIRKDLISYIGSKEFSLKKGKEILRNGGSIGIVSDRGMPCVSDPGAELIEYFRSLKWNISIIPGVSSVTTAFTLTGLKGGFNFIGFLPRKESMIKKNIETAINAENNVVFFESSNRINKTLSFLSTFLEKKIYLLRELTKTYEEILIGTPVELKEKEIRGELVIIIPK